MGYSEWCWFQSLPWCPRTRAGCKEGLDQLVKKDQSGSCTWMLIPVVITDWKAYVNHCRRYSIKSSKYISEIVVWVLYRIAEIWFQSLKDVRPSSHVVRLGFYSISLQHMVMVCPISWENSIIITANCEPLWYVRLTETYQVDSLKVKVLLYIPVDSWSHGVKRPSAIYAHGNLHPFDFFWWPKPISFILFFTLTTNFLEVKDFLHFCTN